MLVEWLIVAGAMTCLFGCVLAVRLYASLQLQKLDEARQDAWHQAMDGCTSDEPVLKDMARELLNGEIPFPDGLFPSLREAERAFSVTGIFSVTGHKQIKFICNPRPARKRPLTDLAGWVVELFS